MKEDKAQYKQRKHPLLYQAYKSWAGQKRELQAHKQRLIAIEDGRCNLDPAHEWVMIEVIEPEVKRLEGIMFDYAAVNIGPPWYWMIDIHGIGETTASKFFALFDNIETFENVSQFWRFAGQAVIDGEPEIKKNGEPLAYSNKLKSECYILRDNMVRAQTPVYMGVYYAEKQRQQQLYPEPVPAPDKPWKYDYSKAHIDKRAKRKMVKVFLCHLWVAWRTAEGLPVTEPYVLGMKHHSRYIKPARSIHEYM